MRTYRIEIHPASTLNVYAPDGELIESRPVAGVDALIEEVETAYGGYTPDHPRLGRRLFDWLNDATGGWMDRILDQPDGVSLGIDVADGLRHLPWELMMRHGQLVCAHSTRPFTPVRRASDRAMRIDPVGRPLRVLFMACSPEGVEPLLRFEEEETTILDETRDAAIDLVVEESGSLAGLRERIEQYGAGYFDVFHLTGHATARGGQPRFVMEDELGLPHLATAAEIADALGGQWPRLVFLSGCSTGEAPKRGALPSLAEELVRAGAPAVLGWALPVFDRAASQTAASLYALLGSGMRVDEAVALTRRTLLENPSEVWHLLRLYADATPLAPIVAPREEWSEIEAPPPPAATEFLDAGQVEVCPRERFVGRRRVIQRCLRVLRATHDEDAYADGVMLHGMGGLGKTSLAARLCERMPGHERVVIVGEVDEDRFVRAFSAKLQDVVSTDATSDLQQQTPLFRERLARLFDRHLASTSFLFVFDDFEKNLGVEGEGPGRNEGAIDVLTALLDVIHEAKSASRVIVTSRYIFPLPGPARLVEEGLETLRDAELRKKTRQLRGFKEAYGSSREVVARAVQVGAGNPRLLERLDALLSIAVHWSDANDILKELEGKRDEFREGLLLEWLLARQEPDLRRMVALAAVFGLPVPREAVEAAVGAELTAAHLDTAVGLTLVDRGRDPADGAPRFFVSDLVIPLVAPQLSAEEKREAKARGADLLYRGWREGRVRETEPMLLEIHRLAMESGSAEIAVEIAYFLRGTWINRSRFRDTELLCADTLRLREDFRIVHALARAERVLGKSGDAVRHFERALSLCPDSADEEVVTQKAAILHNLAELLSEQGGIERPLELYRASQALWDQLGSEQGKAAAIHAIAYLYLRRGDAGQALEMFESSLAIWERIGDDRGRAATLHTMGYLLSGRGDGERALELFQQSLELKERMGSLDGQADTLHAMAVVRMQRGEVDRALKLFEASLALKERIGDMQGKSATLHAMAVVFAQQGDITRALALYQQSLELSEATGALQARAATLHAMAHLHDQRGDFERAMELYRASLALDEQVGNARGRAGTLHAMAGVHLERGDLDRALELYRQSLELKERLGNLPGKAATLGQMAGIYARQGDSEHAVALAEEALALMRRSGDVRGTGAALAKLGGLLLQQKKTEESREALLQAAAHLRTARAWLNLSGVLAILGRNDPAHPAEYLCQACWLAVRVEVPAVDLLDIAEPLLRANGAGVDVAPVIAAGTWALVTQRTEGHPDAESLRRRALDLLDEAAETRGIPPEGVQAWGEAHRLYEASHVLPRMLRALEERVPAGEWLFDRRDVGAA